ncbi:MAG: N-acetylmuramoyl-L-alanine amidase [Saprospiraceae bacterium]|nr:N-acetylmuramoyl-L-alanine amidase [Saprospiraceae bacterium]
MLNYSSTVEIRQILLFSGLLTVFYLSLPLVSSGQSSNNAYTVVLDAGHGGKDPGCSGVHSREKEICLNVALRLGEKIKERHPEVEVVYTRDSDVFIPLKERAAIANRNNSDLFISLHCNYIDNKPHVHGAETYVMGLHKTRQNLDVAKRENSVIKLEDNPHQYADLDPDSPLGHIILQNVQSANLEHSIRVASLIQAALSEQLKRFNRGVKQAGFIVLYYTTMPAVLVEMGFLSNRSEEDYLLSEDGTENMADALSNAFSNYYTDLVNDEQIANKAEAPTVETLYRIQIAASRNQPISQTQSGPWEEVDDVYIQEEGGLFKYLTGNFRSLEDANIEKERLRDIGFNGAFIVAYKDNVRISISSE